MSPFILPPFCATYLTLSRRDLVVGLDQAVGDEELEGRSQDCVRLARLLRSSYRRNSASGRYGSVYESLYHFRVAEDIPTAQLTSLYEMNII